MGPPDVLLSSRVIDRGLNRVRLLLGMSVRSIVALAAIAFVLGVVVGVVIDRVLS